MNDIKITDVRALPGDSAFLVDDGETAIMYDSGFAFTGFSVAENIKKILGERKLDYIFLTHSHYDHVLGSVYVLEYYPEAKIVAGEYAAKIFAKPTAKAVMRELDAKFAAKCGVSAYPDLTDNLRVDIAVSDGDVIKAGRMEFEVLALPGHTKCSVAYYCRTHKLLLGCETTGVFDGVDDVIPAFLVGYEMTMNSIARAGTLELDGLLVPHYGMLDKLKTRQYLIKSEENTRYTAEFITQMLKEGRTVQEVLDAFCIRFYHGSVKEAYPEEAMRLNTGIMIELVRKERGI